MRVGIRVDLTAIKNIRSMADRVPDAIEASVERAGNVLFGAKNKEIAKTYKRPPEHKRETKKAAKAAGRKKPLKPRRWKRTGDWQEGQAIVKDNRFQVRVVDTGRPSNPIKNYPGGYAQKLSTLPVSSDGVDRANPAAENAVEKSSDQVQKAIEQTFANELRRGR